MRCRLSLMDESTFAAVWYAELREGHCFGGQELGDSGNFLCQPACSPVGQPDESLLEKGEDVSGRFLALTALQEKLRAKGTPEMELVLTALLVRILLTALAFHAVAANGNQDQGLQHIQRPGVTLGIVQNPAQ